MTESQDEHWMRCALELAERGRGHVEPNPLVGAVVVRDGQNVGEGWHQRYGQAHAEVNAFAEAGEAARGATLYVTLEPCCHHGKTPPCTDAVLRAGVRRVVAAMADPFPQVAGQGAKLLRQAGVEVAVGMLESEARRLNAPYLKLLAHGRPWVHAKWAMTLDGKIATASGDSQWISNQASRHRVHELRGRMDAIIVGGGTVRADDPLLTARPPGPRIATRVVLEGRVEIPRDCQLIRTAREAPVMIVRSRKRQKLSGIEIVELPSDSDQVSVPALLDELGRRRMTNVLVEGGSAVLGSFLCAGEIDEVHVFIAPKLAGGVAAKSPIGGAGVERIADALKLQRWSVEQIEGDVFVHGRRDG
jgi:diaminohydroxyphosphoribosylaminopyrimidine deaminase/5-amino-6-(5-phosphoribosylamino)uracil reductase